MDIDFKFEVDNQGIAYTYANGVKGTLTHYDTQILCNTFENKSSENTIYVETGSYLGCSAVIASKYLPIVYCHDIWEENMNNLSKDGVPPPFEENYLFKFYKNIKDNNLQKKVIPIRGDSAYTLNIHDDESIDVAFIDGDHSYEGVKKDLNNIKNKMKKDGIILCHDYQELSVKKAINEFIEEFELNGKHMYPSLIYKITM